MRWVGDFAAFCPSCALLDYCPNFDVGSNNKPTKGLKCKFNDKVAMMRYNTVRIRNRGGVHMNLKDAFRLQNKFQSLMDEASAILQDRRNILKVKTTHLRSKVVSEDTDVEVADNTSSEYAGHATEVAAFLLSMLAEREKLCAAIHDAKANLPIDMDNEVGLNRERQQIANTLRRMMAHRSEEKIISGGGTGYRFNNDGNQMAYKCDSKVVTTIDFDRDRIRGMAAELSKKSDETSATLDKCLINTEVKYTPPFDLNDSFDETRFVDASKLGS